MPLSRLKNQFLARIFTAFPSLAANWGRRLARHPGEIPWAVPRLPLRQATVGLVTTGGVHLRTQKPFDMTDPEGDPSFREVPFDAALQDLQITHDYYDHRDAENDLNLVFPVQRLRELKDRGVVGELHPVGFSLMGHIEGRHLEALQEKTAVEIARKFATAGVDYVLLVPA